MFGRAKVIHSAAVWENPNDGKLYSININDQAPKWRHDYWTLNFMRTYADCIVTTGKILRKEKMAFHPDIPDMLGLPRDVYFKKRKSGTYAGKPVAILTQNLQFTQDQLAINQLYLDPLYKKHILTKPQVLSRYQQYLKELNIDHGEYTLYGPNTNTQFDPIANLDLEKSISYLQ